MEFKKYRFNLENNYRLNESIFLSGFNVYINQTKPDENSEKSTFNKYDLYSKYVKSVTNDLIWGVDFLLSVNNKNNKVKNLFFID